MIRRFLPKDTEQLIRWYERFVSPVALVFGFLADTFIFLSRVDEWTGHVLLLSYLAIATAGIVLVQAIEAGRLRSELALRIAPFIPIVVQFAFGGLFSAFLSLYSRSASLTWSWLFVAAVAALLLGNERFRARYRVLPFQISILFIALLTFLAFFVPLLVRNIGLLVFLGGALLALGLIVALLALLRLLVPEIERSHRKRTMLSLMGIFLTFNILYFTNAIPPLPLALKEAGVYHSVVREGGSYRLLGERRAWYEPYLGREPVFTARAGESAYVYTAVFAPRGLSFTLVHEWERQDARTGAWAHSHTVRFAVIGGRDEGYRGYSAKSAIAPGRWRVSVRTEHGAVIGRVYFTVRPASESVTLIETVR